MLRHHRVSQNCLKLTVLTDSLIGNFEDMILHYFTVKTVNSAETRKETADFYSHY